MTIKTTARGVRIQTSFGNYYANQAGVKVSSKGKAVNPGLVLATLTKGEARQLRKGLRKAGYSYYASAPRDINAYDQALEAAYSRLALGGV